MYNQLFVYLQRSFGMVYYWIISWYTFALSFTDYERHRALSNVMANEEYAIPRAIVLCQDNVQVNDNVIYLPIYMLMFMQHEQTEDVVYKFQPI